MTTDFTGHWKANLHKSKFLGPPPKDVSVEIAQSDTELREEMVVTKLDGSEERVVFECSIDSGRNSLLNGRPLRGRATWEGMELIVESWVQLGARELHLRDCWSLSSDGRTLTMEHRDDDLAGQLTILERVDYPVII